MRDPKRIARIVSKLHTLWLTVPDQRLGQVVHNLRDCDESCASIFYEEDDKWEQYLDRELEKATNSGDFPPSFNG